MNKERKVAPWHFLFVSGLNNIINIDVAAETATDRPAQFYVT